MAPYDGMYRSDFTAAELKKIPLPASFPCKECGREKSPEMFANKHLNDYRFKKNNNRSYKVTRTNTTMRCRNCTGEQVHELKCEGQCGLWKPLDEYSKNTRRMGENWCKTCNLWKLSQEPGGGLQAAPGQDLAPDEEAVMYNREDEQDEFGDFLDDPDPEDGETWDAYDEDSAVKSKDVWDWGDLLAEVSTSSMTGSDAKKSEPTRNLAASMAGMSVNGSESNYLPPHLRGFNHKTAMQTSSSSATTTPAHSSNDYLPPYLRAVRSEGMKSNSSLSNPYEGGGSVVSSTSTIGQQRQGVQFTGYDSKGQPHLQYCQPSRDTSETTSNSARLNFNLQINGRGPQPKGPHSTSNARAPSQENGRPEMRGSWAVPKGRKTPAQTYSMTRPTRRNRGPYSDSEGEGPDDM